jgi:hypothetical protein
MASIIKIKRSGTSGAPSSLLLGELAYSYLGGTQSNGGDRLYIGAGGVDGIGNALSIDVVGGKYFTDQLDHPKGTLTPSSAIIVDANSKIDVLNVDNITIDTNTISATNANGNVILAPNGNGTVDVNTSRITSAVDPVGDQDVATKKYVDDNVGASFLTINGDTGTDTVNLADSNVRFAGDSAITTAVTDNRVTISLDETAVTAGSYGSASAIPTFTVDKFGRLTAAGTQAVSTDLSIDGDTGTDTVSLLDSTLSFTGGIGIDTVITNNRVTIKGELASDTNHGVARFNAISFSVDSGAVSIGTGGIKDSHLSTTLDLTGHSVTFAANEISNGELANSSITINSQLISLGGSHTFTTTDIGEGNNLYYTTARFDSDFGDNTTDDLTEGSTNLYYTQTRFDSAFGDKTTSDLTEGSNLYYTTARADSDAKNAIDVHFISGDGAASYNTITGIISITGPSAAETRAHFSGGTGVTYTSGTGEIAIGQSVGTSDSVQFNNLKLTGNAIIDGDLQVNGTQTTINSTTLEVQDAFFYLNQLESDGSPTISVDIGFAGNYNDQGSYAHTGFFRDATDQQWKLFDGYTLEPDSDLDIDVNHASFNLADLTVGTLRATTIIGVHDGFDSDFATKTTDDLTEGSTNLYYTTARADSDAKNAISAGEGIDYNATTGEISAELASETNLGVATFDGTHFTVTSGDVTANDIIFGAGDDNSGQLSTTNTTLGGSLNIYGDFSQGIQTTSSAGQILIVGRNATNTSKGVASFGAWADSAGSGVRQFTITAGDVAINAIDGGTY